MILKIHFFMFNLISIPMVMILLPQSWSYMVDPLFHDAFLFWNAFRDPENGLYCDTISFDSTIVCGSNNNRYSSAGTGMGLIADCVFAEIGLLNHSDAKQRTLKTITTLLNQWPRERFHGFFVHFTNRAFDVIGEYSTVDTTEMTMGALFAGNYFGGDVKVAAENLANKTSWSDAIKGAKNPTIFPVVNGDTGAMSGNIEPYNEYYLVSYLAKLMDSDPNSKASIYFNTFMGSNGPPPGYDGHPVHKNYWGYDLLTDNPNTFMSSFIPQFCWFLSRGFHTNEYYSNILYPSWLLADMKFWSLALTPSDEVWGHKIYGKIWGCGAGDSPSGYHVERIDGSDQLVFSAAIMAGFLGAANDTLREQINTQLSWLYENNICAYQKKLPDGTRPKILWRCSAKQPNWRANGVDSIDFSTMVLGYATNFVSKSFYATYAA